MEDKVELSNLPDRLLTAVEIAKILNISRAFAYQLMQRGKIRADFAEIAQQNGACRTPRWEKVLVA